MINKVALFKDPHLNRQIDEIVNNQFEKLKEIKVTFSAANEETKTYVGFKADRFFIVDRDTDIRIWRTKSDDRYIYLKSSGTGTATIKVWRGE